MTTAAALIRQARIKHRLTQYQLAVRGATTQTAISRLERGHQSPTVTSLRRLLAVMGEDLELSTRPIRSRVDQAHLRAELALPTAERLERALAWMAFNRELQAHAAKRQ